MPHPYIMPPSHWHCTRTAQNLLAALAPHDLRLILYRCGPGPDLFAWHPDSAHGAATYNALESLRQRAVGPAYAMAPDDCARTAALAAAQRAPTVSATVASRFGDPARWLGFGPHEATRRFRANWR